MNTIKLILNQRIDLALIVLYVVGIIVGIGANAPTVTTGGLLFAVANTIFNIGNKVLLIKSGCAK